MNIESKIEAGLLLDQKFWRERKEGGARPLRKVPRFMLQNDEAIYERVRVQNGLETLGEARDMIGAELCKRAQGEF